MTRKRGNGSIYRQRGCSTWMVSYYAAGGTRKRESTGTSDYREAQAILRSRLTAIDKGEPIVPRRRKPILIREMWQGLERHYQVNARKSVDVLAYRWQHLEPVFADLRVDAVTHERLNAYVDARLSEKAKPATVNRELSALKTALRLGQREHRYPLPVFPHLAEHNIRKGFVEEDGYRKLVSHADESWLRLILELGFTYGWRKSEITGLRVRNVNLRTGVIRLEDSKNGEPREVTMSTAVRELVRLAVEGKNPEDPLLMRKNGSPVRNFRIKWKNLTTKAGYPGLLVHDLRRSAARELRLAGVAQSTIMSIGGWKTDDMFRRYAISDNRDKRAAIQKREQAQADFSHDLGHDPAQVAPEQVQQSITITTKRVQ